MTLQEISLIVASALWLLTGILLLVLLVKLRRQDRELGSLRETLNEALARVALLERSRGGRSPEPENALEAEQLRSQLKARLAVTPPSGGAPEKYRYLASMACHGMKAEEIAEVLKISPREAEQLVKLAQVARRSD